jgi:4-hydroxy-tetrahydrodipicolinate synthase
MKGRFSLIAAIGTPLHADDTLHVDALRLHLEDQWAAGITGVLVGGTMGLMQLLDDATYAALVEESVSYSSARGELMVGAGDTSLKRTRNRISILNRMKVDGAVVLAPYFWKFDQAGLITYYKRLADFSTNPLFVYDVPGITGTHMALETLLELARHPNIAGVKSSRDPSWTRRLADTAPPGFRVLFAEATMVDVLMHHGVREHLDGVFAIAPRCTAAIARAAMKGDWDGATVYQHRLTELLEVLKRHGVFESMAALLNERGIPGKYAPEPFEPLTDSLRQRILAEPASQEILRLETEKSSVTLSVRNSASAASAV